MKMKLDEAIDEGERYLAYLERQKQKSLNIQKVAADVRTGKITPEEGKRRRRTLDGIGLSVYDGAKLEQAIKVMIEELRKR